MAQEYRLEKRVNEKIKEIIKRFILALIIGVVVTFAILKFKIYGLAAILTLLLVYHFMPAKTDE